MAISLRRALSVYRFKTYNAEFVIACDTIFIDSFVYLLHRSADLRRFSREGIFHQAHTWV